MTTFRSSRTGKQTGIIYGFRSGLEEKTAQRLNSKGISYTYEAFKIDYVWPATKAKYTPDFKLLDNGIIVETKGRFLPKDRQKHLLIKDQHPEYDIRFVFTRSASPISKGSKTTYASWCEKHGFKYADKEIPEAWLMEKKQ